MPSVDYNDKNYDYTKYWDGRDYENQAELIALEKLLTNVSQEKVIDIGGGFGRLFDVLKTHFRQITIFDYSQKLLEEAKARNEGKGALLTTVQGDIYRISALVSSDYDCAVCIRVSHHLDNLDLAFSQISKILKPGAFFILEIANKIHFKAALKGVLQGDLSIFTLDSISRTSGEVTFLNHHPQFVESLLGKYGFIVVAKLSVSNFRSPLIKKIMPRNCLVFLEKNMQRVLSRINFGPSLFYKLEKS